MSLATNIQTLATAIGADVKNVRGMLNGNLTDLSTLTTTTKASLLAAINEVNATVTTLANAEGGATIDDLSTSTSTVWSSSKTTGQITAAVAALVDTAPGTLDTLNELAAALGDNPNFAATTATALGNRVAVDAAQTFTELQKTQGRANLDAASAAQGAKADTASQPGHTHTIANVTDATAVGQALVKAADAAAARSAIGAGTSSLVLGTAAGTAAAGNDSRITGAVPNTRTINTKPLSANITLTAGDVGAATAAQGTKADTASQPGHTHTNLEVTGLGGAALLNVGTTVGTVADGKALADEIARATAAEATKVPTTRTVSAGTGLTGGGDLSANRSLAVSYGTTAGTAAQGNDSRIVNAVPNTRTVNGKPLSANITLTAGDVGAGTSNLTIGTVAGTAADAAAVGDTTIDYLAAYNLAKA